MACCVFFLTVIAWLFATGGELEPNGRCRTCPAVLTVPANASATCCVVRSSFQILTSSTSPVKKFPGGVTLELAPTLTGLVPEGSGGAPDVCLVPTFTPSIYN